MPTAIVSGALANKPYNGGNAWTRLSWVRGLERLGYAVYFVEQIDRSACVDESGRPAAFADSVNVAYFRRVTEQFNLAARSALVCLPDHEVVGIGPRSLPAPGAADLLWNISGHLTVEAVKAAARVRAYFDDDPGFTQFWHAGGSDASRLAGHDVYYTIGQNIGAADCPIPTCGIPWRHTVPPVVLEDWAVQHVPQAAPGPPQRPLRFTTVASWRGPYGPVTHGGNTYGPKAHQFRKFVSLRRATGQTFEIALDIHPNDARDLSLLRENGWQIADPRAVAASPDNFRSYVRASDAEFSVAQGVYVDTNSGWFSDRTTRYLASGRPALVQDTGFARHFAAGAGLVPFRTLDEAVAGAADIAADYLEHSRAARAVAERHFDSDRIIRRVLDELGLPRPR